MGKHSSDSDSDRRKTSHKSKTRHSSSSSSESRSRKHKRRDRSRDKYSRSRKSRSNSETRKSKSRRRSRSHDRPRHKRSRSRDRHHKSRHSRDYVSKTRRRSNSSSSKSEESSKVVVNKSPQAAPKVDLKAAAEINEDGFTPKPFVSSKSKKVMDNIVIDLKKQTIKVPEVEPVEPDSIFHHNLFLNEEARMEKWIKELYGFRQKALQQGLKAGDK